MIILYIFILRQYRRRRRRRCLGLEAALGEEMEEERARSLRWKDSARRKLWSRRKAGETARLIRLSRALVAMERDCSWAAVDEPSERAWWERERRSSIWVRLASCAMDALRMVWILAAAW